jgi:hypothetical protein
MGKRDTTYQTKFIIKSFSRYIILDLNINAFFCDVEQIIMRTLENDFFGWKIILHHNDKEINLYCTYGDVLRDHKILNPKERMPEFYVTFQDITYGSDKIILELKK